MSSATASVFRKDPKPSRATAHARNDCDGTHASGSKLRTHARTRVGRKLRTTAHARRHGVDQGSQRLRTQATTATARARVGRQSRTTATVRAEWIKSRERLCTHATTATARSRVGRALRALGQCSLGERRQLRVARRMIRCSRASGRLLENAWTRQRKPLFDELAVVTKAFEGAKWHSHEESRAMIHAHEQ